MATALETLEKRALRGVIRAIEPVDGVMSLICADVEEGNIPIATELPVEEVQRLNLRIGDAIAAFPISFDTYLIIGKPN